MNVCYFTLKRLDQYDAMLHRDSHNLVNNLQDFTTILLKVVYIYMLN